MITDELYNIFRKSSGISTDSRKVMPGSLFFALKGDNYDGNRFTSDALSNGAAYAIIDNTEFNCGQQCILVDDTLQTLQNLAMIHRSRMNAIVIAITGSNGKTTTKELTGRVLSSSFDTITTIGNLNNHIGVPLTLLSIKENTRFAVVEMGANHPGEIANLCVIAQPAFGIITNIGKAHLEGFGGFEGVIKAKSELYNFIRDHNGLIFINGDDSVLTDLAYNMNAISYGTGENVSCKGEITGSNPFLSVNWSYQHHTGHVDSNLYGNYNLGNILAAITIGSYFGVNSQQIGLAISSYIPENNRSQLIDTGKNKLVLDAYNANPSSMYAALVNFARNATGEKMIILGDMMELGEQSLKEHKDIHQLVNELDIINKVFIGPQFSQVVHHSKEICFKDINEARDWFNSNPVLNKTILLKGSRKMQLESLVSLF